MTPRQASLTSTYYPHLLGAALLSVACYALYLQLHAQSSTSSPTLRRSNARRRVARRRSIPGAGGDLPDQPTQGAQEFITEEALFERLKQSDNEFSSSSSDGVATAGRTLPGIDIPESVAEGLTERGHAAQDARGAGGDGREGRAGRRSPDSEYSFVPAETSKENMENQNLLTLLYTIAQDQANRESYVHRGVTCNSCQTVPIRGIRYRCANCLDFDLCEVCEAIEGVHPKTHLFLKIRIPAPFIGNPQHAQVPCYPGKPHLMPTVMSTETIKALHELTKLEQPELEALYEQFKVLANTEYNDTKYKIKAAISRAVFDRCFLPNHHVSPTSPNLIHDRMFAFYDTNNDGLISFEEFILGVSFTSTKTHPPNSPEKIRKIFQGYDLDGDGYVSRHDFQRMFKAFYSLSKDVIRDIVASQGEDHYDAGHMDMVLHGRQPISAAFTSSIPTATEDEWRKPLHPQQEDGDFVEIDSDAPATIAASSDRRTLPEDGYLGNKKKDNEDSTLDEIERHRRWKYWAYPPDDMVARDAGAGQEEGLEGEGEYELPSYERDVGSEVLYQMSWQAINELLDTLFKAKEREASLVAVLEMEEEREKASNVENGGKKKKDNKTKGKKTFRKPKLDETDNESSEGEASASADDEAPEPKPKSAEPSCSPAPADQQDPIPPSTSSPANDNKTTPRQSQIEKIKQEIKERGGPGRLNFEEFKKIMSDRETSRKLEFVGTWTGLASF